MRQAVAAYNSNSSKGVRVHRSQQSSADVSPGEFRSNVCSGSVEATEPWKEQAKFQVIPDYRITEHLELKSEILEPQLRIKV